MSQLDSSVFVIYREGNAELDRISESLNLKPDKTQSADDKSPNSVWTKFIQNKEDDLETQLEYWIGLLDGKADVLHQLREDGWSVELDCLVQPEDGAALIYLEPILLKLISNLSVSLKIRYWD